MNKIAKVIPLFPCQRILIAFRPTYVAAGNTHQRFKSAEPREYNAPSRNGPQ